MVSNPHIREKKMYKKKRQHLVHCSTLTLASFNTSMDLSTEWSKESHSHHYSQLQVKVSNELLHQEVTK